MGIIIRQSIKGSFWSYAGLVLGYINLGIIMPKFLEPEQVGLIQLFAATTLIFAQFSTLGFPSVINRMFPFFRNRSRGNNGFLFLALATGLLGFLISIAVFYFLKPYIIESNIEKSPLIVEYIGLLTPVVLFRVMFILLDNYNKVLYDAVTGTFWGEFIHKAINLSLIVGVAMGWLGFRGFFFGYVFSLSIPTIPLIVVLIRRSSFNVKPNFEFLTKPLVKEICVICAFGLINGFSGILTLTIDKIFINQYLSLEHVGIFSVCVLFATLILIPSKALQKISTGIIAQAWKENNTKHIQEIFWKASLNQSIIGAFIFVMLVVNLNNIFTILPEEYSAGRLVLIIYALGVLIRVSTTNSGAILVTSAHYKALTYIIIMQAGVAVLTNMLFIPLYGIEGAAMAVFATYLFRTIIITVYLKMKFNLFCYTNKHLLVLAVAVVTVVAGIIIPETGNLLYDILLKSLPAGLIYVILTLVLKLSDDINKMISKVITF